MRTFFYSFPATVSFLLAVVLGIQGKAQAPQYVFHHLTIQDGLSDSEARFVTQDRYGYIWIATSSGLNRFDGRNIKVYPNLAPPDSAMRTNRINMVHSDPEGNLWASLNRGLYRYDLLGDTFRLVPASRDMRIWKMAYTGPGAFLVSTNTGFFRFFAESKRFVPVAMEFPGADSVWLKKMSNDFIWRNNRLYTAGYGALVVADFTTKRVITFPDEPLMNTYVNELELAANGDIWFSSGVHRAQIHCMRAADSVVVSYPPFPGEDAALDQNMINVFLIDSKQRLWVGTFRGGLFEFNPRENRFNQYTHQVRLTNSIPFNNINHLFEGKDGTIWVGSSEIGLSYFHPDRTLFRTLIPPPELNASSIDLLCHAMLPAEGGGYWLATTSGLVLLDSLGKTLKVYRNEKNKPPVLYFNILQSLAATGDSLWIGTGGGMNLLNTRTGRMQFLGKADSLPELTGYYSFLKDRKGNFWIGSSSGIRVLRKGAKRVDGLRAHPALGQFNRATVSAICEDRRGHIWFGFEGDGIASYIPETGALRTWKKTIGDPSGLMSNEITNLAEDKEGIIWASSLLGLHAIDPETGQVTRYGAERGLHSPKTTNLVVDDQNRIWIGTANGLALLDAKRTRFVRFDLDDGLNALSFIPHAAFKMEDGRLVFPSFKGVLIFHPDDYQPGKSLLDFFVSGITVGNRALPLATNPEALKGIHLKPWQNYFSVRLAALDFLSPGKVWFAYKLEPGQPDWVISQDPTISFAGLPGGTYRLRIKASADPNDWDVEEKVLDIDLEKHYYQTWWFRALIVLLVAALAYLGFRYRLAQTRKMLGLQNKAQVLEKEKTHVMYESLKQQLNPHFLFNSLTALSSLATTDPQLARRFIDQLSKIYRYILKNRDTEVVTLAEEVPMAQTYIDLQQTRFPDGFQVSLEVPEEMYSRRIVPVTLQNLIENAIKHNVIDPESPLLVEIFVEDDWLIVQNNLQKKRFVATSNKQGLKGLSSLYQYLSSQEVVIQEAHGYFTVKIPLL